MIELHAGPARVMVSPDDGGRVAAVTVAGLDLLVRKPAGDVDPLAWGMYPMAPWAGRVRDGRFTFGAEHRLMRNLPPHAIHGTVFSRPWVVEHAREGRCRLSCPIGPDGGWPFAGRVTQTIDLDPGGLHLRMTIDADEPMPATIGWHPWFVRDLPGGGALEVELNAGQRWERGADGLPTGRHTAVGPRPDYGWDDCFTSLSAQPVLTWPGALELTLLSSCEHWVLFDATSHAVCVEPQTGPPDALNLDPYVVTTDQPLVATFDWSWRLG